MSGTEMHNTQYKTSERVPQSSLQSSVPWTGLCRSTMYEQRQTVAKRFWYEWVGLWESPEDCVFSPTA